MACPHGCRPERWVTQREAHQFIEAVAVLGGQSVMFGLDEDETRFAMKSLRGAKKFSV